MRSWRLVTRSAFMTCFCTKSSIGNGCRSSAVTKLQAEGALADSDAVSFRLGTLFGVGDEFSRIRLDLVVNTLTVRAQELGRISVFGGDQFRPLLHVKDAARTFAKAVDQPN